MQMDQARPVVRLRYRELGRCIHQFLFKAGFDKPVVEIGGDEANALLIPRQIDQRLVETLTHHLAVSRVVE